MPKIKVLLAEDHTIVRKGLRSLLDREANIEVVDEAEDGMEAIKKVQQWLPDVVLMDISMPTLNGLEATRRINKQFPDVKVLILTMHTAEEYIFEIIKAGASGYIVKGAAPLELILAIEAVHRGDAFLSPTISKKVIEEYKRKTGMDNGLTEYDTLTPREREVLQLIAEGRSTRGIADILFISVKTCEAHRSHIMAKLGLHNTADIVRYAVRKGIVDPG